eukprot:TRINITY_DN1181_c0_g2_i6.p1 TRINITY_DN1181_c0_g2~~TRINITY_DN1181_c0_g2_i6.p1  ORF type:complete len:310 (+),score=31.24 TRINITY_DN1181_c0_g2_i6:356-1285(+)
MCRWNAEGDRCRWSSKSKDCLRRDGNSNADYMSPLETCNTCEESSRFRLCRWQHILLAYYLRYSLSNSPPHSREDASSDNRTRQSRLCARLPSRRRVPRLSRQGFQGIFSRQNCQIFQVRVYDDNTKSLVVTFNAAAWYQTGHSNRVFSIKFVNDDPNILLTGGWDNTIRVWDIRESTSVRAIYGPTISGDSLDYSQGTILTGSYRNKDQLQLWDFGTGKVIQNIDWGGNSEQVYIYAAQFSKFVPHYIIAGCSGANQVRIFDRSQRNKAVYCVEGFNKGVYSVDFCNNSNNFSFGGGDASVYFMDLTM